MDCTSLTNVVIPEGVTSIEGCAFSGCTRLTNVVIPQSVTRIGAMAFSGCSSLTSIRIPSSVTEWGLAGWFQYGISSAFSGCTALVTVTIDYGVRSIPEEVFSGCSSLTTITIPDSVTSIGERAFSGCTGLTSITIPDSVTTIGYRAFEGCTGLSSVMIGNGVTTIEYWAFEGCTNLTSVTIGNRVTSISGSAFGDYDVGFCTGLQSVYFRGDAPEDTWAFYECPATVYYLPGTIGWGPTFSDRPTAPWVLPNPVILGFGPSFGVRANQFGFIISWATNDIPVDVEACVDPTQSAWAPVGNVTLKNGWAYFSDADWANHPARFYRVRSE